MPAGLRGENPAPRGREQAVRQEGGYFSNVFTGPKIWESGSRNTILRNSLREEQDTSMTPSFVMPMRAGHLSDFSLHSTAPTPHPSSH